MKKWFLGMVLALCAIVGLAFAASTPAAAEGGAIVLPKGAGSGKGFIYYDFVETTEFEDGVTYAFLDDVYGPEDAVAQLGSGAVLQATSTKNNCDKYIKTAYGDAASAYVYVDVVTPGKGFDRCPSGGLYKVPDTSGPTEYRYFCWAGGARNCGPLYAYTYKTAEITWDNVTVSLNDPGNTTSSDSADYTVELTYGDGKSVTLDPRSYEVSVDGRTATITITDNDGNAITGTVTLPCGVTYQPGGQNVTDMPDSQGILPGSTVAAAAAPSREGYAFQHWTDGSQTYSPGAGISYKADGSHTLTAVWKDTQAPTLACGAVEVTTGTSGEVVQNSIKAALKITDNEPISECAVTVAADDATAKTRGEKQVSVTVTDKAGNTTTQTVTVSVLPGPLSLSAPSYDGGTLSATILEPGPDTITETGIVWSVISNPTTTVNNGRYFTTSPATEPDTSISTRVELAQGVTYYTRAYAVVDGVTYYGPQATIGDNVPSYGTFTISNNGSNTFTISRSGGTGGAQTVYYRTVNGSAVAGTHFEYQSGTVTFAAGETSKTITVNEYGVNATYDDSAATGYSNASRTYSVEIYRVDGGAVIEGNRDSASRTMTGNTTVDRNNFDERTEYGDTVETTRGDYKEDGALGWTNESQGSEQDHVSVQPTDAAIRAYVQAVSQEIRFYMTFDACEQDSGYQAVQIVPGDETDTSIYPYDKNGGKLEGSYSASTTVGYTALFEHGKNNKNTNYLSYRFPADTSFPSKSTLTEEKWQGTDTGDYIAFPADTQQVTVSYGACGDDNDKWKTKNVVYHYQFIDTEGPSLLAIGDMGNSTYRVGDSFTVSLVFDEIVDNYNSTLSGTTISTSWGTATYAGGADTNVLYFTGTVSADATSTLSVIGATAIIKDMAGNAAGSVSGNTTASVDTRTPSFTLSSGSISGGVGQATISDANNDTASLRYAWSQSSVMPATGWIPLTSEELSQAKTSSFTALTRQEAGSGVWYLHVLGTCDDNGALAYQSTIVDFGNGSGTDPEPAQPSPTISVSVDNTNWATSRTITVTAANGTAQYRYGTDAWRDVSDDSVTVNKNGTYAFRCVSASGEAATASATVDRIDTTAPTASIGAMTANTPTQNPGVYHSVTLPVSYGDAQSGISTAEYAWSSSETAPSDGWTSVHDASELTYTAIESGETSIYLHLKVTDQVGNTVTVTSPAYQVISQEGAKAYAPTVTIGLAESGGEGFTAWDGSTWTNETQTLVWKLEGEHTDNCVVTLPDGRTTTDTSGTILVSQNGTYAVSVVDKTYGGSNSSSLTIDKIDTTAPTVTHSAAPEGWQSSPATIEFTFDDQGGSGLNTAKYAIVTSDAETPTNLTDFTSTTGGSVTVSADGTWYVYYEVTDGTAGTYGDGTARPANTTSGFVGPIQINTQAPTLEISGGMTSAASLELSVTSDGSVTVAKNDGDAEPIGEGTYTVTEAGTYAFTATSNAGLTATRTITVHTVTLREDHQLVVSSGTVTKPANPTKTGYTFAGWYSNDTKWNFEVDTVTSDLVLEARWSPDADTAYTVYHWQQKLGGGTELTSVNYDLKEAEHLTGTTDSTVTPPAKSYEGFTSPDAQEVTIAADGSTVVNYYYTRNSYTVTLTAGRGIASVTGANTYAYGSNVTIDAEVSDGYDWKRWSDGTTEQHRSFTMGAKDVSLSAEASPVTYSISYELGGGTSGGSNPTTYTVESEDFALTSPARAGYAFAGWTGTGLDEPTQDVTVAKGCTGDRTYTATWTLDAPAVELSASADEVTYGTEVTLTATARHDAEGLSFTYEWYRGEDRLEGETGATLTLRDVADSGSYTVRVSATDGTLTSSQVASNAVSVTIGRATPQLSVNPVTITYGTTLTDGLLTGSAHCGDAEVPGTFAWDAEHADAMPSVSDGGVTQYGVTFTPDDADNYGTASAEITLTVNKALLTPTVSSVESKTYDGGADTTGTVSLAGAVGGEQPSASGAFVFADANAGVDKTVTVTVALDDSWGDNYELSATSLEATADITPKTVGLVWAGLEDRTYDGTAQSVSATATDLVGTDTCSVTVEGGAETEAGTHTARATSLDNPNYQLPSTDISREYVISPLPVRLSWQDEDRTYDGSEQTVTATIDNLVSGDDCPLTYEGNAQTDAGTYTAKVTSLGNGNYTLEGGTGLSHDWAIAKRRISGTWQGLSQIYDGSEAEVGIILNDLVAADKDKAAVISSDTDMTSAGDHALTATLDNYEITNGTATLVIRRKTVLVAVTDNAVTAGGEPTVSVPGVAEGDYVVTYKDASGDVVTDTSQPDTYEVWVSFTNENYCHSNGTADAQVGTFTVTAGTPTLYDVTFDGNGADGGSMTSLRLAGSSTLTLPECGYTKTGHQFVGWLYGGRTYQPGEQVSATYGSMTVKAQWQAVFEVSGTVTERTEDGGTQPVSGAVVSLWLGANKVGETSTDADGTYGFADLLPGTYNLVASKDVRTVTSMATIADASARNDVVLPVGATNSVVEVTPGSPDIVVGNLDTVFEKTDETVYTKEDAAMVEQGGKVEITFTADERQAEAVAGELEKLESVGGGNLSLFLDCTLTKTVTDASGGETSTGTISQSTVLLDVRLPLPSELQGKYGYTVARVHDGEAQALGTMPNDLGEYYEVSADRTYLTLHVRCFSTYAVGYRNAPSAPTYPPVLEQGDNGTFAVSPSAPTSGQVVTIAPEPDEGYVVGDVTVLDRDGKPVEVTPNGDGTFSFVQPAGSVTVSVSFLEDDDAASCPRDETCPLAAFEDLDPGDWYHDGVHFCLVSGLMTGYGDDSGLFGPADALSREQAAAVLWRALADGAVAPSCGLSDVEAGQWYTTAVDWTYASGLMTGYADGSGLFGVGDALTRDQFAMMLANVIGADLSKADPSALDAFSDGDRVAEWAVPAVSWAVESGILKGSDDGEGGRELRSGAEINRAEMAAMAMRAFS